MSRAYFLFLSCLIFGNVSCYLIGKDGVITKEVQVNTDDEFEGDVDDVHSVMGFPKFSVVNGRIIVPTANMVKNSNDDQENVVNKEESPVENPSEELNRVGADGDKKKCAEVGQFCNSHSDCCSYACLGYMKRCVSG